MGIFISKNLPVLQFYITQAIELGKAGNGADFTYLLNQANLQMLEGIKRGLKDEEALEFFLLGSWLAMAAAEVDTFPFGKYSKEDRETRKYKFFDSYLKDNLNTSVRAEAQNVLGKFFQPASRIDLLPQVALERLGIHNELCAIKWADPSTWQREGFIISKRVDSAKRHFDSAHTKDYEEDHIAHLSLFYFSIYLKLFSLIIILKSGTSWLFIT